MAMQGWTAGTLHEVDGNRYKVHYRAARPVDRSFELEELEGLARRIGILDEEGEQLEGYSLVVDTFGDNRNALDTLHDKINPHTNTSRLLVFNFHGFPTDTTMDVMQELERTFQQQRKGMVARILGRLGLRKRGGQK